MQFIPGHKNTISSQDLVQRHLQYNANEPQDTGQGPPPCVAGSQLRIGTRIYSRIFALGEDSSIY